MAHLTPSETDRIIQVCLATTGAAALSLMAAWRAMVFQMLERIELGRHRPDVIELAREIVALWGAVQPAHTYPPDHQFLYPAGEVEQVRNLFIELNRLGLAVLLSHPELPPRPQQECDQALERLNEIALYVRNRLPPPARSGAEGGGRAV